MGRRPDSPELQAAKGFPGKRKSRVQKQLEQAAETAKLLAAAPGSDSDPLAPPLFLDHRFAPALAIWHDYAPKLARINLLRALDRMTFATFCVYMGEWVEANEAIQKEGYSRLVKTTSGDRMPRLNPNVERRDTAMRFCLDLSQRFGLSPIDRLKLFKDLQGLPPGADLFRPQDGAPAKSGADTEAQTATPAAPDAVGAMDTFDSPAPRRTH